MSIEKTPLSLPVSNDLNKPSALEVSAYEEERENAVERSASNDGWNMQLLLIGLICSLSSFNYGYNIGDISGPQKIFEVCSVGNVPDLYDYTFPQCIEVGDYWGFVVAAFCVGGMIGALSTGSITNKFGRKKVLIFHNVFYILGTICMSMSTHLVMLIFGRLLLGIGSGVCTVVVPMYLSEIATNKTRGTMGTLHQAGIVIGILVAQCCALVLINVLEMWRLFFGIVAGIAILQIALLIFVKETPKYLASKGNLVEAEQVLRKLRGKANIDEELQFLASTKETTMNVNKMSVLQLVKCKNAKKSLTVGLIYHAAQQLSGINVLFYFGDKVMEACGLRPGIVVAMVGLTNVIMTGVSIWLMDKAGRRPLFLASSAGMCMACVCMIVTSLNSWNIANVAFVLLFVASFAVGMGPVPWVIIGDIFPSEALDAGTSLSIGTNWTANTIIGLTGLPLFNLLTADFLFLPFAILCALFFAFSFIFVPETKGKQVDFL